MTNHDKAWNTHKFTDHGTLIEPSRIEYSPLVLPAMPADIPTTMEDEIRYYHVDGQLYPSITSVLRSTDHEGRIALAAWRKKIGHEAAAAITTAASSGGTSWHTFAEKYLKHEPTGWGYISTPDSVRQAFQLSSVLNANVKRTIASELSVYSKKYGVAGRLDAGIEITDGRLAILDFKTGKKPKTGNRLAQAGIQCAFYADALTELMDFDRIDTVVVVQILPTAVYWQTSEVAYWRPILLEKIEEFKRLRGK